MYAYYGKLESSPYPHKHTHIDVIREISRFKLSQINVFFIYGYRLPAISSFIDLE